MKNPAILLFSAILFIFYTPLFLCQADIAKIDKYIEDTRIKFEVPGISVGIIKDGKTLLLKGYGYRDSKNKLNVDAETVFGLASVTKAFTAACLGILVDQKKLNWEDKVIDYLPWFRLYDEYAENNLTIIDLLTHRSGLGTFDGDLLWYGTNYSREEVLKRIRFQKPDNSLRAKFGYQNVMYVAAGEVIEVVSGMSWDEFLKKNILDPLNMKSASTSNTLLKKEDNVSLPHVEGIPEDFINYDNVGPAGSLNASASDLLKWLQMWLDKGTFEDKKILSPETIDFLKSPQTVIRGGREEIGGTHFRLYGVGWELWDYAGRKIIDHGGGLPGIHTQVAFIPEDNLAIVILTNQISPAATAIYRKILDEFLNDKNVDYAEDYLKRWTEYLKGLEDEKMIKDKERITGTSPTLELQKYTGTYKDESYGDAEISYMNDTLVLKLLPAEKLFTSKMEHWQYNTFRIKFEDPFLPQGFLTFDIDLNGRASGFRIHLPNPDFHFHDLDFKRVN